MTYRSSSSNHTKTFARGLAQTLVRRGPGRTARVIALYGELGAGKTTFVKGFASALKARGRVVSPTFIIVRRMPIARGPFKNLFHIDAYRLNRSSDAKDLDLKKILSESKNIIIIEWPERLGRLIPKHALRLSLLHGATPHERIIRTTSRIQ